MKKTARRSGARKVIMLALLLFIVAFVLIPAALAQSRIFRVQEGELVRLRAEADDLDKDHVIFRYSPPLDANGEWQTNSDDAGEYDITLTASDGVNEQVQQITLIVENVNRPPALKLLPLMVREGEKIDLSLPEKDADGEMLQYALEPPLEQDGTWQTDFDDAGEYELQVSVTDGEETVKDTLSITIVNVDRAPLLTAPALAEGKEGEEIAVQIRASDPDGDVVQYRISSPIPYSLETGFSEADSNRAGKEGVAEEVSGVAGGKNGEKESSEEISEISKEAKLTFRPDHDAIKRRPGVMSSVLQFLGLDSFFLRSKTFPVRVEACGGEQCTSAKLKLLIHNVNRQPAFTALNAPAVKETETVRIEAEAVDPDGDAIRYLFGPPLDRTRGTWETTYGDAGTHTVEITATDGKENINASVEVTVLKDNRPPILKASPSESTVREGEEVIISFTTSDPDDDNVTLWLEDLPEGASFHEGVFSWVPGFDVAAGNEASGDVDSGDADAGGNAGKGFFKLLRPAAEEAVWLRVVASDGEAESILPVKIIVQQVNRGPRLLDFTPTGNIDGKVTGEITAKTNQPVLFHVAVKDDDKDMLTYEWEFGFLQGKVKGTDTVKRTFLTPGRKTVKVTASDGEESVEKEWRVKVE